VIRDQQVVIGIPFTRIPKYHRKNFEVNDLLTLWAPEIYNHRTTIKIEEMLKTIILSYFIFCTIIVARSQTIQTGVSWVNTSSVTSQTSPDFTSVCGPINYTISTDIDFKQVSNGTPYNNNCIIFPSNTSMNGTTVFMSFAFSQPVQNLRIRVIDLDENVNNLGFVEEYLSEFNIMPTSITNLGMGINPLFLTASEVTPDDGNNSNANNNASCWLNWSTPVSTVNFTYHRLGSGYGLIVDSIYFDCAECNLAVDLGPDVLICNGESTTLNGAVQNATSYLWNTGATSSSLIVNTPGTYTLSASNSNCSVSDTVQVTELVFIPDPLPETDTICEGSNLSLIPQGSFSSYLWNTNDSASSINVQSEGVFWVEVSNGQCIHRDSILIVQIPSPEAMPDSSICTNSSLIADGYSEGVSAYLWSTGETASSITISAGGNYTLQRTLYDCVFSDDFEITLSELPESQTELVRICTGDVEKLMAPNAGIAYSWSNGGTESFIPIDTSGIYTVLTTTICGQVTDTFVVKEEDCSCTIYIPNTFTPNGDEHNNRFGPVYECVMDVFRLEIYNRWGEIIWESVDADIKWDGTYLDKLVQDGVYTYIVTYSGKNSSEVLQLTGHVHVLR
jgi:gliding motility-associated-like protein